MKFRIAHKKGTGYFAHVKLRPFGLWHRIAIYNNLNLTGIYFYDLYLYPKKTESEALELINKFKEHQIKKELTPTFKEIK